MTTERGRQFTSALWEGLCQNLQINHISTTAYHPQSNGLVERTHRQIKDALGARLAGNRWPEHLPWVLFSLHAAMKEDSAVSSAELVFGATLTLPGQLLTPPETPVEDVVEALRSAQPLAKQPLTYAEAATGLQSLQRAEFVYMRKGGVVPPLSPLYQGPYKVLDRREKFFKLEIGGQPEVISVDRLKPHLGTSPVTAASPPQRGRPRGPGAVETFSSSYSASTGGAPVEDGIREDRNPQPSKDDYINVLPDFLCSVVTCHSSNKELYYLHVYYSRVATKPIFLFTNSRAVYLVPFIIISRASMYSSEG